MGLGHARLPIPPTGYGAPRLNRTIAHCLQDSRSSTKLAVLKNLSRYSFRHGHARYDSGRAIES